MAKVFALLTSTAFLESSLAACSGKAEQCTRLIYRTARLSQACKLLRATARLSQACKATKSQFLHICVFVII
ncbi:MAG: hypothetical protein RR322_00355 [Oscillospiraceae bacterium]